MGSGTSELVDYSVHFWDMHCREEGFNPHSDEHVRRWTRSGNCPSLKQVHHCPGSSQRVTQGDFEVQKMTGRWYITAGLKPQVVVRSRESMGIFIQRTATLDEIGFFKWAGQGLLFQKNGPHNFNLATTSAVCLYYVGDF